MITPLLTLPLRCKRDLVVARQRAGQIAGLLGFERRELAGIAAAVFEIAGQVWRRTRRGRLTFQVSSRSLCVTSDPVTTFSLAVPFPDGVTRLEASDVTFAVRELGDLTPLDLLAEMQQQNLELLRALHDLKLAQRELADSKKTARTEAA